jgi:hypothetical protein
LKDDPDVGWLGIEPEAFNRGDKSTLADLGTLLDDVRRIYGNARLCKELGRDEAAWSYDVVYPLGQLVLKLYGRDKWWFHPV